jgi:CRISPR-associated protein (TIGR02584 family)
MGELKHILLCVAGGTPAIITETLWALKDKEHVDEIRVITTLEGREKILTGKINGFGSADTSLLDKDQGQFYKFLREFPEAGNIRFDENCLYLLTTNKTGVPSPRDDDNERLKDILTDEDNEKAANQICAIVQELAGDQNVRLHASIAGGRKTMSLYLMAAMQLYGRNYDVMSHVLVSKEVEFGAPKFFYKTRQPEPILDPAGKPKTKMDGSVLTTADINIYLAKIPFVWLRGIGAKLLDKPVTSYAEFVTEAQNELEFLESANELRINTRKLTVKVFNREAELSLRHMFVYSMFAYFRKHNIGENGYVGLDEIAVSDLEKICRFFVKVEDGESAIDAFRSVQKRAKFIDSFIFNEVKEKLLEEKQQADRKSGVQSPREANVPIEEITKKVLDSYRGTLDRITERLEKAKIDPKFDIDRKGTKRKGATGGYIFGLNIAPEKIKFE